MVVTYRYGNASTEDFIEQRLSDEGYKHTYFFPSFILSPGAKVTIFTGNGTNTATELYMGRGAPIWNNDGDIAILRDANGNIIDQKNG